MVHRIPIDYSNIKIIFLSFFFITSPHLKSIESFANLLAGSNWLYQSCWYVPDSVCATSNRQAWTKCCIHAIHVRSKLWWSIPKFICATAQWIRSWQRHISSPIKQSWCILCFSYLYLKKKYPTYNTIFSSEGDSALLFLQ